MTQEELAERAEISARGLRYLEGGIRQPYRDTVRRLAAALELRPHEVSELSTAARVRRQNLAGAAPLPSMGEIIGREEEIGDLLELLHQKGVPIVSVTGPGGVGKTRLAVEVAACLQPEFADGVFWVPLADIDDPVLVGPTIAQALGVGESAALPDLEEMVGRLTRRGALLVLDNFEHVIGAATLVSTLVRACPTLKVLVTSRTPLRLSSEHEFRLAPLRLPNAGATEDSSSLRENPAIELFTRRARAVDHRFALTDDNAGSVTEICRRLDGLPLALELAAARVRILSLSEISDNLGQTLALLTGGPIDAPARQRSLRDTLVWSCRLLGPAEQRVLWRIAVFSGGCTLAAVRAVCAPADRRQHQVVDALDGLQRSSLISREEMKNGEARFVLLETVREYALERLTDNRDEESDARSRHASYYADLALGLAGSVQGREQAHAIARLEQEHDNLRAALRWWLHAGEADTGLRVAGALWMFWYVRGYATEGRAHVAALLALPESDLLTTPRALALLGGGQLARAQGDYRVAEAWMRESVALYRAAGDGVGLPAALLGSAFVARAQGDHDTARRLLKEGLPLARAACDRHVTAATLHHLGMISADVDEDYAGARALLEESLALYQDLGAPRFIGLVLTSAGSVKRAEGDRAGARALFRESLHTMRAGGETLAMRWPLDDLARVEAEEGNAARATRLAAAADRLRERAGASDSGAPAREEWLTAVLAALGEEPFWAAWAEGRAMSPDEVVAFATRSRRDDGLLRRDVGDTLPLPSSAAGCRSQAPGRRVEGQLR